MNPDFRKRVFTPLLTPLTTVGALLLFAFSLSRVLLAVPELVATFIALAVATYALLLAGMVAKRPRIASRSLAIVVALGMIGVVTAGAVAAAAGMRELEHGEEAVAEGEGAAEGDEDPAEGEAAAEIPADAAVFVAVDIDYSEAPETLPAGEVTVAIDNQGAIVHNVVFEELGDAVIVEAAGGETAVGTVTVEAGQTYTYYCSIPGHRAAGMEGALTVEG